MFWDFHESKRYPCTQKISSLALKLTILGLKNFLGKMLILGTPFQPLWKVQPWPLAYKRLLNKPYVNEVTLTRQNPPLKCFQLLELMTKLKRGLDLSKLKIWGL